MAPQMAKATINSYKYGDTGRRIHVDRQRRKFIFYSLIWATALLGYENAKASDRDHPAHFLDEERRKITDYYRPASGNKKGKSKGLPPGLAKRGGNLPPGLQKHIEKNGQLPPGLQKRLEPLPTDLSRELPRLPDYWERVIVERDVILLDRRTNRILDIIEDVIALATGQ
jgi:hypothetical protein